MQKEVVYGLAGLVIGVLLAVFVASYAVNNGNNGMMRMMGMNTARLQDNMMEDMMHNGELTMSEMMKLLEGKTGDSFDQAFIKAMIQHHEEAIEMAEQARTSAKHQEIKDLSEAIIKVQTDEINQMKIWQKEWGY